MTKFLVLILVFFSQVSFGSVRLFYQVKDNESLGVILQSLGMKPLWGKGGSVVSYKDLLRLSLFLKDCSSLLVQMEIKK